jgi:REP element-mobilizing transposase RayT
MKYRQHSGTVGEQINLTPEMYVALAKPQRTLDARRRLRGRGTDCGQQHAKRWPVSPQTPVHVTVRVRRRLPNLRKPLCRRAILDAFDAGKNRFGFRLIEFSIQSNHLHLICEAGDRPQFVRGIQGLLVRIAKALNKLWGRKGKVFERRYHDRIIWTSRQARRTLAYVLGNGRKHRVWRNPHKPDPCSSGPWFRGWKEQIDAPPPAPPTVTSKTFFLKRTWSDWGELSLTETPGPGH